MFRPVTAVVAALLLGSATMVSAQYAGPSSAKPAAGARYANVAEIVKNPQDDVEVTLEGHLLRQVGKEKFVFSDGTGEIRVEIDAEDFPATKIDEKTRVKIRGEVEKDFMQSPQIDVKQLTTAS